VRARRIGYLLAVLAVAAGAFYSGERVAYVALMTLAGMPLLGAVSCLAMLWSFHYSQWVSQRRAVKGEQVTLFIHLENGRALPIARMTVTYRVMRSALDGEPKRVDVALMPGQSHTIQEPMRCPYRGVYTLGVERVQVTDPLGLVRLGMRLDRRAYHQPVRLAVFNRVVPLSALKLPTRRMEGQMAANQHDTDETASLKQIRAYQRGDPLKRVHWKLTARARELMVRQFEQPSTPENLLLIDCAHAGLSGEAAIALADQVTECAAAFAGHLLQRWSRVRLVAYPEGRQEMLGDKPADFHGMHRFLALLPFTGRLSMADVIRLETDQAQPESLFLVSTGMPGPLFDTLVALAASGVEVLAVVVVPEGSDLAAANRILAELANRGVRALCLHPGEDLARRLEGTA
jgi:uncharacterized protein (DUF58 family)